MRAIKFMNYLFLTFMVAVTVASIGTVALPMGGAFFASAVAADGTTAVVLPWGDWVSVALTTIGTLPISSLAFGWLVTIISMVGLPQQLANVIKTMLTEQVLGKAVDYGINSVAGAVKGRQLNFTVGNEVVANAANYLITYGPQWVVEWLGGLDGIKARLVARLEFSPSTKIETTTQEVQVTAVPAGSPATGATGPTTTTPPAAKPAAPATPASDQPVGL